MDGESDSDNPFASESTFDDVNLLGIGGATDEHDFDEEVVGSDELSGEISLAVPAASSSEPQGAAAEPVQASGGMCGFLSPAYYRPYFDVDTVDVQKRLMCVVMPWKPTFFTVIEEKPDFYGPFWICTTLIFLIAATYNFTSWRSSTPDADEPWQQDFKVLSSGVFFVFGFAIAMPFVAWASFQYLGVAVERISFAKLACVYGYSIFTFWFACIMCVINIAAVEWLAVLTALGFSTGFLVHNLHAHLGIGEGGDYAPPTESSMMETGQPLASDPPDKKKMWMLLVGLVGLHFVFAMVLKFSFFDNS